MAFKLSNGGAVFEKKMAGLLRSNSVIPVFLFIKLYFSIELFVYNLNLKLDVNVIVF